MMVDVASDKDHGKPECKNSRGLQVMLVLMRDSSLFRSVAEFLFKRSPRSSMVERLLRLPHMTSRTALAVGLSSALA